MNSLPINTIIHGDASDILSGFPKESIDLTITSPPYDGLRIYNGFSFDFIAICSGLWNVTKPGGIVVWVVNDAVENGSETGSSFRQALRFMEIGFNLHDTMIYAKANPVPNGGISQKRYQQSFEYMFVFSKGKPKTFNMLVRNQKNKWNDGRTFRSKKFTRKADGTFPENKGVLINSVVPMENIWFYTVGGGNTSEDKVNHPAVFPEQLVLDHIITWSNPGDVVLDPMIGSGTTAKMAKLSGRNYIGIDISKDYCIDAQKRVDQVGFDQLQLTKLEHRGTTTILASPYI